MNQKFSVEDILVDFQDIEQVIGMGGPWVGKTYVNEVLLMGKYVVQEPVVSSNKKYLGLVSYRPKKKFWDVNHFKLILIDLSSQNLYEYSKKFHALCIDRIEDEQLIIYESFHKELKEYKNILPFRMSDFKAVV